MTRFRTRQFLGTWLLSTLITAHAAAQFGGSGKPWEKPMEEFTDSITGPVAKWAIMIAVVASGLALAFTDGAALWRKALFVVFGGSIAFGVTSIVATLGG